MVASSAVQVGPGLVFMTLSHAFLGKGLIIQTVTPLEPVLQHVVHQIYFPRKIPSFVARLILWAERVQVRGAAGGGPGPSGLLSEGQGSAAVGGG